MLPRAFRDSHWKVDQFRGGRVRQSDEQFLAECAIPVGSDLARVALAVRRCVADIGLVDSAFVEPGDRFPGSLDVLPLWDSMDFIDFVLRLERELDVTWNDREDSKVFATPFTVLELIHRVHAVATPLRSPAAT